MKTNRIFIIALVAIIASVMLGSCETDDTLGDSDSLSNPQITMTGKASVIHITIRSKGKNIATINWGDGTTRDYIISDGNEGGDIRYQYKAATNHTITISCETITYLNCSGSYYIPGLLTSLDVSGCTALTELDCSDNILTSLNVSGCTALTSLDCYQNILTSLDVSGCTALIRLDCRSNQLTSLDVSGCTALTSLDCYQNILTSLDVSGCTALTELDCSDNILTSLNVSGCTMLSDLNCRSNQLTAATLNALFGALHSNTIAGYTKTIYIRDNPGTGTCDRSIATTKGWTVN